MVFRPSVMICRGTRSPRCSFVAKSAGMDSTTMASSRSMGSWIWLVFCRSATRWKKWVPSRVASRDVDASEWLWSSTAYVTFSTLNVAVYPNTMPSTRTGITRICRNALSFQMASSSLRQMQRTC